MFLSTKQLNEREADICRRTVSPKASFAIIGDALHTGTGISVVRMGDGEVALLRSPDGMPFNKFDAMEPGWNRRLGIEDMPIEHVKANIVAAGNGCTYFAPSVSGISRQDYALHDSFNPRDFYFDNFFVNDWTKEMIRMLLVRADGAFIIHANPEQLISNFSTHYEMPKEKFSGFEKRSWRDNGDAVRAAIDSGKQLVLFSAGPAGKVISTEIAREGRVVLDVGNTLPGWSTGNSKNAPAPQK